MEQNTKWVSATIFRDTYKTEVITDSHALIADEPLANGGKDLGPSPGDFLRTSLATCTAITLRMYANRKNLPIEKIEVKVHTEQVDGKTIFHSSLLIDGTIDEQQRKRLIQIANACPVHKMLTRPIEIQTVML
jgi:putative redox protein